MKKFFVIFALLSAMFLMISCGGSSKTGDTSDTGETVTDEDGDTADESEPTDDSEPSGDTDPDDSENPDTTPDNGDTAPDSGDSQPDNDADTDSGDTVPDQDTDADTDTDPVVPSMEEGIYLGIIGFNNDLTKKPIKRLTDANKSEFKSFINSLTQLNLTALYWADYSALDMMENFEISPDLQLKKVALVTFTDGLDNQSLSSDDFNPGPYDSHAEYLDAIHSMIMDEDGIHGQPVTAYSIGLKGADVTDEDKFVNTLEMLATEESGDEKYFFRVSDMNEVGQLFADIAASLYSVSTTINVGVYIPGGYDNGQVIRYTFDNVSAATSSNLYIEATYHRSGSSRTLENIKYEGFIPGASTISSSATGPNNELYFQFNDLKYSNGDPVSQSEIISKSRLWKQTSSGAWDGETEMNMAELPPIIDEDKSSALIMLVLDSTTSLGSDFAKMQNEAKNFVEILVNGGSGVTESSPCDDNPCATLANSTHICTVSGSTYTCGCNSGYTWNGWQCTSSSTPCNPNPCTSISNSNGNCIISGTGYTCGCQSGYNWTGTQCAQPSTPCNPNPCGEHSDGICTQIDLTNYSCGCDENYFWTGTACESPCDPNPCEHSCTATNLTNYSCGCDDGYFWNGTECTVPIALGNLCTGQTSCYNASSSMTCPESPSADFFGQDAYYANLGKCTPQRFTVQTISSQKVVLDNNTGLVWQQTIPSSTYTWSNAISYCNGLTYAGYSDWRLPSPKEFHTISDNSRYAPAFDTTYFPSITNSDSSYFWTSQESKSNTSNAYYVWFYTAYSYHLAKTNTYNVMCVRGYELPNSVFTTQTISGEVVVNDSATGLMWQKEYVTDKTWQQALKYCEDLSYAGYTNWRLPNKNEATSLLNYNKSAAPYSDFPEMPSNYFWSSTTHVSYTPQAWYVDFHYYGRVVNNNKTWDSPSVRCVRSAE